MERINRDIKTIYRLSFGSTNFERIQSIIIYSLNSDAPILEYSKSATNKRVGKPMGKYKKLNLKKMVLANKKEAVLKRTTFIFKSLIPPLQPL